MKRKSQFITSCQLSWREIPANLFVNHVPPICRLEFLIFRIFLSHTYDFIDSKPCYSTGLYVSIGSYRKWFQISHLDLFLPLHTYCNYFFKVTPQYVTVKKSLLLIWGGYCCKKEKLSLLNSLKALCKQLCMPQLGFCIWKSWSKRNLTPMKLRKRNYVNRNFMVLTAWKWITGGFGLGFLQLSKEDFESVFMK